MGMHFLPFNRNENDALKKCSQSKSFSFKVLKTMSVLAYGDEYFIKFSWNVHCETILDKIVHFYWLFKTIARVKSSTITWRPPRAVGVCLVPFLEAALPFPKPTTFCGPPWGSLPLGIVPFHLHKRHRSSCKELIYSECFPCASTIQNTFYALFHLMFTKPSEVGSYLYFIDGETRV